MGDLNERLDIFGPVIRREEGYGKHFARWRELFRNAATELANLFKSFPGTGELSQQEVAASFTRGVELPDGAKGETVFDSWNGWWCGTFHSAGGDAVPNYHIWDPTISHQGASLQPVTQSVTDFVPGADLEARLEDGEVDLAINVHTPERGITGWVSKHQGGQRLELPTVGYLLNANTLIWITQIHTPEDLDHPGDDFLMFFEWSTGPGPGERYGIHGRELSLAGGQVKPGAGPHWGTYDGVPRGSAPSDCPEAP